MNSRDGVTALFGVLAFAIFVFACGFLLGTSDGSERDAYWGSYSPATPAPIASTGQP